MAQRITKQSESSYQENPAAQAWYSALLHTIGFVLLLLVCFDLIASLVPIRLMDPNWEFQFVGDVVERVAVPLIAVSMIFYGDNLWRGPAKRWVLSVISWLCLLYGVFLFLLIPVALSNVQRLDIQTQTQLGAEYRQQMQQAELFEEQLRQANNEDLQKLANRQTPSSQMQTPQTLKAQLLADIANNKQKLTTEYQQNLANRHQTFVKNGIKWSLGALVSGTAFIYIWRSTRRVRQPQSDY